MNIITEKDVKKTKKQIAELVNNKVNQYRQGKKHFEEKSGGTCADIVNKLTADEYRTLFNDFAATALSSFAYDLEHKYTR